jgi:hypothetical protein
LPTIAGEQINGRGNSIEKVTEVTNVPDLHPKILENIGLAVKTGSRFSVPWESIVAEFKLAA